jgi:hypothetical protein
MKNKQPVHKDGDGENKILKPVGGMQMWYYRCARLFRYPIPTEFEFAYINRKGEVTITAPFDKSGEFSNGIACVVLGSYKLRDGKWTYAGSGPEGGLPALLKSDGTLVTRLGGTLPAAFYDKYATSTVAKVGLKSNRTEISYELMDVDGKIVTNNKWLAARAYSEGLVAVAGPEASAVSEAEKQAASVPAGSPVVVAFGYSVSSSASQKMGPVPTEYNGFVPPNSPWGFRDQNGKTVIASGLLEPGRFSEGLAVVEVGPSQMFAPHRPDQPAFYHPQSYAYIDRSGKSVIPGPYMEANAFAGGLAAVMKNGKWGYIDRAGKEVVPFEYDWAGDFKGLLAPVEKNELVGYIDKSGKAIIDFRYKDGKEFSDGKRWGYIDESGKEVIAAKFQRAFPFNDGLALVYIDSRNNISPSVSDAPYFLVSALNYRKQAQFNNARMACKTAIECDSAGASAAAARTLLKCALPDHDLSPEVEKLYRDGNLASQMGNLTEAERLFKEAQGLDPEFFTLAGSLAFVYKNSARSVEGIALLKKTLEKHPDYARGYWWLSQLYKTTGDEQLAKESLAKAASLDPDDPYFSN